MGERDEYQISSLLNTLALLIQIPVPWPISSHKFMSKIRNRAVRKFYFHAVVFSAQVKNKKDT